MIIIVVLKYFISFTVLYFQELPKATGEVVKEVKDIDSIVKKYISSFQEKEEVLLLYKNENPFQCVVDWKQLLFEGLEQRHMIDVTLYRYLDRIDRYLQTKYERHLVMKSRQEKEPEKSEIKKSTLIKTKRKLDKIKSDKKQETCAPDKI